MRSHESKQPGKVLLFPLAALIWAGPAMAFESYHNPSTPGQGYCATCHDGFVGGTDSPLHFLHTEGNDAMTGTCSLCHTGSGRDNPLIMWSQNNQLGCMGCHGRDYGETIEANYRTFNTMGLHKNSGYGLRRHHAKAGVTSCADCHENDSEVPPYPENVVDPGLGFTTHYYTRTDVGLRGLLINPCNNEDTLDDADNRGLDNDGDGLYDGEDPDCTGAPVMLSIQATSTNALVFAWPSSFDGWRLQSASSLAGGAWADLSDVPRETTNGLWQIVLPASVGQQFLRLAK